MPYLRRDYDYTTKYGAALLAFTINEYWKARGLSAHAYVYQEPTEREAMPLYCVRSRMIRGRP